MEVYPVLPIQQKSPDSDQVCHITHIVCRIHFPVFCIIFQTLTHQLFHQMFGVLQAAVVRLQSDLFFLVLQKFCHKFFSDLFQRRPVPFIIIRNFQQFFPGNICFFKFLRQNSKFLQKLVLCQIHVNSSLSLSIQRTGFFFFRTHPGETRPRCVLTHRRDYSTFIPASQVKSLFKNAHFHFNLSANFLNFP